MPRMRKGECVMSFVFNQYNVTEKKFLRSNLLMFPFPIKRSTIVLPYILYNETLDICNCDYEQAGFLYCSKGVVKGFECYLIEYIRIMTEGSAGNVCPHKKVVMSPPEKYVAIEFHVHPQILGAFWHDKFSSGDYREFDVRNNNEIAYKHVLFTPTHIITYGNPIPDFKIERFDDEKNNIVFRQQQYWQEKINKQP